MSRSQPRIRSFRSLTTAIAAVIGLVLGVAFTAHADDASKAAADATRARIQAAFGFVPGFMKAIPDRALPGAWQEMEGIQLKPDTALPGKIKELIGLAVSAQVPCRYCIYAHTQFARLNGATDEEIGEAVGIAALARHWSTYFNGLQLDETKFRAEIQRVSEHVKKMMAGKVAPPTPIDVVDAKSAYADVQQNFGFVPDFIKRFPPSGVAGAWIELRDVELDPETALPSKYKSLISLAVASQIPCRYCVIADTEFARLDGATDAEISEAIAMASLIRHWSTYLNGLQVDEPAFRKDIDHLVRNVKSAMKSAKPAAKK
jgi:AhpD family alkylhydroperoxidase